MDRDDETAPKIFLGIDPGGIDHTGLVIVMGNGSTITFVEGGEVLRGSPFFFDAIVSTFDQPDDPMPLLQDVLAMMEPKLADDTIRAPRSGGPPPHTLKNYDRRRSNRR